MRTPPTHWACCVLSFVILLLTGCALTQSGPYVLSVTATPDSVSVGGNVALKAAYGPAPGQAQDVTSSVHWSVSDPSLAVISNGALTAASSGKVTVQGSFVAPDVNGNPQVITASTQITIAAKQPVISWSTPAAIQYGTPLGSAQLNATADVAGTFTYSPAAGSMLSSGGQTLTVSFTPSDPGAYSSASATVPLTVNKAPLSVTAANQSVVVGSSLPTLTGTISGLVNNDQVSATYVTTATSTNTVGNYPITPSVSGSALANYQVAVQDGTLTVTKASLQVVATNATMSYGAAVPALSGTITGLLPGDQVTATYSTPAAASSPVGQYPIIPALSGSALDRYTVAVTNGTLTVDKATPVITWNAPASVPTGSVLGGVELNATANVPGTFTYTPAAGTPLKGGSQQIMATFTPADTTDYNGATATTIISVSAGTIPLVVTANDAAKAYGAANPALTGTVTGLQSGDQVSVRFTTTADNSSPVGDYAITPVLSGDSLNKYVVTAHKGTLKVSKANPAITWPTPASVPAGTTLGSTQLDATANVAGSFTYTPGAGTVLTAGTQILNAAFTPTDANYNTATATTSLVVTAPAQLTAIKLSAPASVVQQGKTIQFQATGTYSDGTTKDLTSSATWASSSPSIAAPSSTGLVTGSSQGTTQITAVSNGVTSSVASLQVVSSGNVININPSMSMAQIQNAINYSNTGDTLAFAPGTYNLANPALRLQSDRSYIGATTAPSVMNGVGGYPLFTCYCSNITVQNFTFNKGGLFLAIVSGVNVENNIFQNIDGLLANWTAEMAIYIETAVNSDFSHNQFNNIGTNLTTVYNDADKPTGIFGHDGLSNVTISYNSFDTFTEGVHVFYNLLDGNNVKVVHNTFVHGHDISIEQQNGQGGHLQGLEVAYNSVSQPLNGWAVTYGLSIAATADVGTGILVHDNILNADVPVESNCTQSWCYFPYAIEAWGNNTHVYNNLMEGNWGIGIGIGTSNNLVAQDNSICGPYMASHKPQLYIQQYYGPQPGTQLINNYESPSMTCTVAASGTAVPATGATAAISSPAHLVPASGGGAPALLRSVAIVPAKLSVAIGASSQLKAIATFSDGSSSDVTQQFAWTSSDPRTIAVNGSGLVSGLATGKGTVSGNYQGMRAASTVSSSMGVAQWSSPLVISRGGTYSGNWKSSNPGVPAVTVATTEPVVIENAHLTSAGDLIAAPRPGSDVTVRNAVAVAVNSGVSGWPNGVFVDATSPARLDVETNYVENARAGVLVHGYVGERDGKQTIIVRANRARNLTGLLSDGVGGYLPGEGASQSESNFVRLQGVSSVPGIDLGWNEVINYPYQSLVGSVVESYQSSGTANSPIQVHDSYVQGAFPYDPARDSYSGGGITTDGAVNETASQASAFNSIHDNQVVGAVNYGIRFAAGHDNTAYNNRVVSSGTLQNGARIGAVSVGTMNADLHGTGVATGSMYNNTMHDNTVGVACWTGACAGTGFRNDQYYPLAASDYSANTTLRAGSITPATEESEYLLWESKLAGAGVVIGPSF